MKKDIKRKLVEITLKNALKSADDSPKRAARNLVDLSVCLAAGPLQKHILRTAQDMLENEESAYYALLSDTIENVSHEILTNLAVNFCYNSCTAGAKKIRAIEEDLSFDIPWSLTFYINEEKLAADELVYDGIIEQGEELGIHMYLLFTSTAGAKNILPLFDNHPDSTFVLFLSDNSLTQGLIDKLKLKTNVMIALKNNKEAEAACRLLRENKLLFALCQSYGDSDVSFIKSGGWLKDILGCHPFITFLQAENKISSSAAEEVYSYLKTARSSQAYPTVLADIYNDLQAVDELVSEGKCMAGFTQSGNLFTDEGISRNEDYNIFRSNLQSILQKKMRKNNIYFKED